jgi:hypothetical protein
MAQVLDSEKLTPAGGDGPGADAPGGPAGETSSATAGLRTKVGPFVRAHALFLALIAIATALRVIVAIAYQPALLFTDSGYYLTRARLLQPGPYRPFGYSAALWIVVHTHQLVIVPIVQHLVGLGLAVGIYLLMQRLGVRRWLAAVAAVPVLFDTMQLSLEQYVMSDVMFEALLLAIVLLLVWKRRPGGFACLGIGILLAAAALTRFAAFDLIVLVLGYLAFRRVGIRRLIVLVVACALPLLTYASWYEQENGTFALSPASGAFLYSRVAPIAQCSGLSIPADERHLCPSGPPATRPYSGWYMWSPSSPWRTLRDPQGHVYPQPKLHHLLRSFAITIIEHQPIQYAHLVLDDYFDQFLPTRAPLPNHGLQYQFAFNNNDAYTSAKATVASNFKGQGIHLVVVHPLASFLSSYSRYVFLPGPLGALLLVLAFLAWTGLGRARRTKVRAECFLLGAIGVLVVLFAVATSQFSWRYVLPELVVVPAAGVLGLSALLGWIEDVPARMAPATIESSPVAEAPEIPAESPAVGEETPAVEVTAPAEEVRAEATTANATTESGPHEASAQ